MTFGVVCPLSMDALLCSILHIHFLFKWALNTTMFIAAHAFSVQTRWWTSSATSSVLWLRPPVWTLTSCLNLSTLRSRCTARSRSCSNHARESPLPVHHEASGHCVQVHSSINRWREGWGGGGRCGRGRRGRCGRGREGVEQ